VDGVHAQCDAEVELKPDLELVSLVTHVVHHAQELLLNLVDVELQLSTADGELSEDGEHVLLHADQEHKPELELVSLVTHVELDALELSLNQEDVEPQLSTADSVLLEHGEHVQ